MADDGGRPIMTDAIERRRLAAIMFTNMVVNNPPPLSYRSFKSLCGSQSPKHN